MSLEPAADDATTPPATPKRRGRHHHKQLAWRPPAELLAKLESYRERREAEEWRDKPARKKGRDGRVKPGRRAGDRERRFPLSAALEELLNSGFDKKSDENQLSRAQADALEAKLDILTAHLGDVTDRVRTLTQLLDAIGPSTFAAARAVSAWIALDPAQRESGEPVDAAEDRILDEVREVSAMTWRLFSDDAGPVPALPARPFDDDAPDGELLADPYLARYSKPQPNPVKTTWAAPKALATRLDGWARGHRKVHRGSAIAALVELGLDVVDGRVTVPLHRAAQLDGQVLELQRGAHYLTETIDWLRKRVEILGARVTGLPNILVQWQARHPDFNESGNDDDETIEAIADELLKRYWSESQAAWEAVVDAIIDPEDPEDDEDDEDLPLLEAQTEGKTPAPDDDDDQSGEGFDEDFG